jgi:branched-chain amino acid transport system substrate-binding protein
MTDTPSRRRLALLVTTTSLLCSLLVSIAHVGAAAAAGAAATQSSASIKFAAAMPLSGPNSEGGQRMRDGIQLAVNEINASGGIAGKTVTVDYYDDEGKPEAAASVAQKIVSDPDVFAVIGHINSSATLAALPLYARAGLTEISGNSSNPDITHQGYKNFFRVIINDSLQGPIVARYAIETLGKTKLALIYENTDYGKGVVDAMTPVVTQDGASIVASETYTKVQDKDFSAQLTKIKAAGPDALVHIGEYGEGGPIFGQAYRLGLTTDPNLAKLAFDGDRQPALIELAGQDAVQGLLLFAAFNSLSDLQATQEFAAKLGHPPTEQEANNYDIVYILKKAIEQGATKETLPDVLHTISYDGVTGHIEFDENGDVKGKDMAVFVVNNGNFEAYKGP